LKKLEPVTQNLEKKSLCRKAIVGVVRNNPLSKKLTDEMRNAFELHFIFHLDFVGLNG